MTDLVVIVPAREEENDIAACLGSVVVAAAIARERQLVDRVTVAVAAHKSDDRTHDIAVRCLAPNTWLGGLVLEDRTSETVGEVRHGLVQWVQSHDIIRDPHTTWLFSTDSDSFVPTDWIASTLLQAWQLGADAAAGLVWLEEWAASKQAHDAYQTILDEAMRVDGHDHVYGANLAVRLDAYLSVGGFPALACGEDQELVNRLRANGFQVASLLSPVVRTSARYPARARNGLGDLLGSLVALHPDSGMLEQIAVDDVRGASGVSP